MSVSGGDVVDYPVMVEPLERGQYHGAVVFVAEAKSGRVRCVCLCFNCSCMYLCASV